MFGQLLGDFSLSLGDFLTKTSGHPVLDCHQGTFEIKGLEKKNNDTAMKTYQWEIYHQGLQI